MFNKAATLLGEITCWSPLGLKWLTKMSTCLFSDHMKNYLAMEIYWQKAKLGKNCLIKVLISRFVFETITSNNQRLGSAFTDLDPRLSLLCYVICPCKKICRKCQIHIPGGGGGGFGGSTPL